jgi:pimeloyl-ACP methyl ester carboxylesterase
VTTQAILLPGAVMPADLAYVALVRALGDDVHAVAKDLEIYAAADPPPGYTLEHETDGVLRTANAAGFDRFQLVGYSAGGAVSLAFAGEHPERLLSLALLEPAWIGNDELSAEERAIWHRFDSVASLAPEQMMPAFVATQLAAGVQPPPPPPGPPPRWMASRPAAVRTILETFRASSLDLDRLRSFDKPVLFALGGKSSPDYYAQMANRAAAIFCDFTLEVFAERHHFDPPHRIEPDRMAAALRALWQRASA